MLALFFSHQEEKQRALTPVVLSSLLPGHVKVEAKDIQIFPWAPKTSTLYFL